MGATTLLLSAAALASGQSVANAVIIDFDALEVANSGLNEILSGSYSEDGFTLSGTPMFYAGQGHVNQYAGSAGLHLRSGGAPVLLSLSMGGNAFDLSSIELSILASYGTSPAVNFTGNQMGGGTVNQSFTPSIFGFTQFNFTGFTNLTSVSWMQGSGEGNAHQFDNINVHDRGVIPEPGTALLLGLGIVGYGLIRRRQRA
jgi:hypothetical protein